jgi:ribosome biogenesis GTPase
MYDVGNNIKVIDTPGIKGFGIVDLETHEIRKYFSEFERYSGKCKFQDCLHNEEPGCQIKEAVENKKISLSRYKNYISLIVDNSKLRN